MASPSIITEENSKTIEAVKVLLLILVIYIHQLPRSYIPIGTNLSWEMIYRLFSETISHNIGRIAVPGFFIFSGYFFFFRMRDDFSANWLMKQWRKRIKGLLLPYIFWNVAFICIIYVKNKFSIGNSTDDYYNLSKQLGFYGVLWSYPINIPLWYIRDLMCMVAISPLLLWFCKYTQWYGILALYLLYAMNLETTVPGFSSTAIFYFSVGTLLAIKKENIVSFANKNKVLYYCIATILLIFSVSYNGCNIHEYMIRLFIPFGFFSLINITSSFKQSTINTLSKFSSVMLFVYFSHWIYIRNIINGTFSKLARNCIIDNYIVYSLAPIIVILTCSLLYFVWKKLSPKTLSICLGGRLL